MAGSHDRIIADAAKAALGPLGFRRKGRSRIWLADHDWWLAVVEFQPSAWSKGCYLNVAAHWLWSETGTVGFDFGGRIAEHVEYLCDEQFAAAAARLAQRAAEEARRLAAAAIGSPADAAALLLEAAQGGSPQAHLHPGWRDYDAAVAAALAGRPREAATLFASIVDSPAPPNSLLHPAAQRLAPLVAQPAALRDRVLSLIERQRHALRLPPLRTPPF